MKEEDDPRPFDEILHEILIRSIELKKKAKAMREEKPVFIKILQWMRNKKPAK